MLYASVPKLISFVIAMGCTVLLYCFLQKSETLYNIAFAISICMVGIACALLLPYSSVQPTLGTTYSFKSFVIIVLGG